MDIMKALYIPSLSPMVTVKIGEEPVPVMELFKAQLRTGGTGAVPGL